MTLKFGIIRLFNGLANDNLSLGSSPSHSSLLGNNMQRRDILKSFTLAPLALLPKSVGGSKLVEVPQSAKSFIERAKYFDYTENDYLQCRLLLLNSEGGWTRRITKVTLTKDPLKVVMASEFVVSRDFTMNAVRFVDKEGRMLFQSQRAHCLGQRGNTFTITYTIGLD